jgi:hypothetical protein
MQALKSMTYVRWPPTIFSIDCRGFVYCQVVSRLCGRVYQIIDPLNFIMIMALVSYEILFGSVMVLAKWPILTQ